MPVSSPDPSGKELQARAIAAGIKANQKSAELIKALSQMEATVDAGAALAAGKGLVPVALAPAAAVAGKKNGKTYYSRLAAGTT